MPQHDGDVGGISPHVSKRKGYRPPPSADLRALPDDYRERLLRSTVEQDRRRLRQKEGR